MPSFGLIDIFNYLLCSTSDYDGKKLKSYKSFDDYRLFYDGHVESVEFNPQQEESQVCLFRAKVRPTQRGKTYLNKDFYQVCVVMARTGDVKMAYCQCIGGSDGGCRHVGATLYAIESIEPTSCTDGANQWMKRPRFHDVAVPVKDLTILKAKYGSTPVEHKVTQDVDTYDPRPPEDQTPYSQEQKRDFGLQLSKISPDIQALDILLSPEELQGMQSTELKSITDLSIPSKAQSYASANKESLSNCESLDELQTIGDDFYSTISYCETECKDIAMGTFGQSENNAWFEQRAGRLTASNFQQACSYVEKDSPPSISFFKSIMCEDRNEAKDNCAPLV